MEPTTQNEPTLDESLAQVMQTLPPVIRKYLAEERYTPIARELMAKYQLRLDQGGILEREIMLLLMGIETPDEFMKALGNEAHLSADTVKRVTNDVNEMIFIPLRAKEERQGMMPAPEPVAPSPIVSAPTPRPTITISGAEPAPAPEMPAPEPEGVPMLAPAPALVISYQRDPYREAVEDEPVDEV